MVENIRVDGLKEVQGALNKVSGIIDTEGRKWLRDWAMYGVRQVQLHTLNSGAVDTNELIQGIHYKITGLTATVQPSDKAAKYAGFVEEGTRPHFPPIKAIQGWADRHGIPAFLVARKIAREGTPPRHMWRDAFADVEDKVGSEIADFATAIVRKI